MLMRLTIFSLDYIDTRVYIRVVKMYMENMENLCLIINIELIDDYPHTVQPQISLFIWIRVFGVL